MSSFCREKIITARKAHQCLACLQKIEPGEKYLRATGVSDGDFWTGAYHPECREWECRVNHENYPSYMDEWIMLHEHVSQSIDVLDDAPQVVKDRFKRKTEKGG